MYLGNISKFNSAKGHITLTLNEDLAIGDTIYTENESVKYTVSELMQKTLNLSEAQSGMKVTIGRMKGNIAVGDKVYKLTSKNLLNSARLSYTNCENRKININANVIVKKGTPISMSINYNNKLITSTTNVIPSPALTQPITADRIIKQISKTSNTPFNFKTINVQLDDGLFIPNISVLNELRRNILDKLQNTIISENVRTSSLNIDNIQQPYDIAENRTLKNKKISVLLRNINPKFDYTNLDFKNINNLYIPLKSFISKNLKETLSYLSDNINTYIYLPSVIKNNYKNIEKKVFCYNENKEKSFLNYCVSNKYFSVQPQITIKDELYKDIKNNAISGLIVLVKINDKTKYEIPTVINYLKSKGYEISNLNDLIKE